MAPQLGALREALIDTGAEPGKTSRAAEELAGYGTRFAAADSRLAAIDARLGGIDARLTQLTWAVGINVAIGLAILAKLVTQH